MLLISNKRSHVISLPVVSGISTLGLRLGLAVEVSSAVRDGSWEWGLIAALAVIFAVCLGATAVGLRSARRAGDEVVWVSLTGRGRQLAARCDLWPVSYQGRPNSFELELRDQANDELLFEVFSIVHGPRAEAHARRVAAALDLPLGLADAASKQP